MIVKSRILILEGIDIATQGRSGTVMPSGPMPGKGNPSGPGMPGMPSGPNPGIVGWWCSE